MRLSFYQLEYAFLFATIWLAFTSPTVSLATQKIEIATGFSAIEEGDDRFRSGVAFHLSYGKTIIARYFNSPRQFGPVEEKLQMVAAAYRFPLFKSQYFSVVSGGVAMEEATKITFHESDSSFNRDEKNHNLGFFCGIHAHLAKSDPLYLSFSWESALFPAGLTGGILMATGRKQMFSMVVGMWL